MSNQTRLQDLHKSTIQILHSDSSTLVGTGLLVSSDGHIITCGQILRDAGINPHKRGAEVTVFVPLSYEDVPGVFIAKIIASSPYTDDDIVLLQLTGDLPLLAPEQVAVLGPASASAGHAFRSYGYATDEQSVRWVDGTIRESVPVPTERRLQAEPLRLQCAGPTVPVDGAAVLDMERNLVVGMVCQSVLGDSAVPERGQSYAIDMALLADSPFRLSLREEVLPLLPTSQPHTDHAAARDMAALVAGSELYNAPPGTHMRVGHVALLQTLSDDWADPACRLTSLIGSSGEGKSSLTRSWLDTLNDNPAHLQPAGILWWDFQANPNVDAFFEAVLKHLGSQMINIHDYPSSRARVQLIGAMLRASSYLYILDGLEVWQHQQGRQYGLLISTDLHEFLSYLAAPEHTSFGLLISRIPLLDFLSYPSYRTHPLPPLTPAEGRVLLEQLGVEGNHAALEHLADELNRHALTITLVASYLADRNAGTITGLEPLLPPSDLPRTARVRSIIERRLRQINKTEHTLLSLLSAIRIPISETSLNRLFRPSVGLFSRLLGKRPQGIIAPIASLKDEEFNALLKRLIGLGLLRRHTQTRQYSLHPLVAAHFVDFTDEPQTDRNELPDMREFHQRLKTFYLDLAGQMPRAVTLHDVEPLLQAVYHACSAGDYDEAFVIYWERIEQDDRQAFKQQLGAYETLLELMAYFFAPGSSGKLEPQVSDAPIRNLIFDTIGFCLANMERLREATEFYAAKNNLLLAEHDWRNASINHRNLARFYSELGQLEASIAPADTAVETARSLSNPQHRIAALAQRAWIDHLRGDLQAAGERFKEAADLQEQSSPDQPLFSQDRIWYAEHLWQSGQASAARDMAEATLQFCAEFDWIKSLSQCHRLVGDMDAQTGNTAIARSHYDEALKLARSLWHTPTLIQALVARGWLAARQGESDTARVDLYEALTAALQGGYRIYEIHARLALAVLHRTTHDTAAAQAQEHYANQLCNRIGYFLADQAARTFSDTEP